MDPQWAVSGKAHPSPSSGCLAFRIKNSRHYLLYTVIRGVLGVEAPLWSETLVTMADVEFMAFPRLIGIAEIGWSPAEGRGWDEYRRRLARQGERLASQGVNFYRDPGVPWI